MSIAAIVNTGYKTLPLSMLDESSTNPRRTFEPSKLVELAQSISIHGLIQPITVRPKGERYEVVAGARRFRAAHIAELGDVPTRVMALSDEQTIEIQIIENSQREDVHAYEEAAGYQRLLQLPGYDVAALASKCGKSQSHVYSRLSLLQLSPAIAEAFQHDRITASHANLLARLTASHQAEAFEHCWRKDWQDEEPHLLPAKQLSVWINENLFLDLADAPFPTDDPALNPEAGACLSCPRRTGFNTQLFPDTQGDSCLDSTCYHAKTAALIERETAADPNLIQISTDWRPTTDRRPAQLLPNEYKIIRTIKAENAEPVCPHATSAIVTHGANIGKRVDICADQDCPVHHPRRTVVEDAEYEQQERQANERRELRKAEREKRDKWLRALILRFPATSTEEQMRFLLKALVMGDLDDALERIALRFGGDSETADRTSNEVCAEAINGLMPSSLTGFFAELALGSHVDIPQAEQHDFIAEAKALFPKTAAPSPATKKGTKVPAKKASKNRTR